MRAAHVPDEPLGFAVRFARHTLTTRNSESGFSEYPMRTSLEIVPHGTADLDAALDLIAARYPRIDTVNIPDRSNCDLRSIDAVHHIRGRIAHRIPHLRACDFDESSAGALIEAINNRGIDEVIVIAGDKADAAQGFEPTALIRIPGAPRYPRLSVYAALDPHRYADDASLARNVDAEARSRRLRILHATAVRSARHRTLRRAVGRRDDVLGFQSGRYPIAASAIGSGSTACAFHRSSCRRCIGTRVLRCGFCRRSPTAAATRI